MFVLQFGPSLAWRSIGILTAVGACTGRVRLAVVVGVVLQSLSSGCPRFNFVLILKSDSRSCRSFRYIASSVDKKGTARALITRAGQL